MVNSLGQVPSMRTSALDTPLIPQLSEVTGEPVLAGSKDSSQLTNLLGGQVIFGPSACFLNVFAARFARSDSSEMDSTRPRPKTGVGMRNDRLSRREKCSCLMLQQEVRRIFQQSRRGCERRRRGYHLAFGGSEPLFAGPSGRINGGMRLAAPNFNPTAT